jgi:hypothetical protein
MNDVLNLLRRERIFGGHGMIPLSANSLDEGALIGLSRDNPLAELSSSNHCFPAIDTEGGGLLFWPMATLASLDQ